MSVGNIYDIVDGRDTSTETNYNEVVEQKEEVIQNSGQPTTIANPNEDWKNKKYVSKDLDADSLAKGNKRFYLYSDRVIPDDIKDDLKEVTNLLAEKSFVMRAEADNKNTLESVVSPTFTFKEIFLPFQSLNRMVTPILKTPTDSAYSYAIWLYVNSSQNKKVEGFNALSGARKAFLARDMHIYLGENLNEVIDFAIIYTPCGTTRFTMQTNFKELGFGINRVIRDSRRVKFKVFNIGSEESLSELLETIKAI